MSNGSALLRAGVASLAAIFTVSSCATQPETVTMDEKDIPKLEHMAIWAEDIDKAAAFLDTALGWKRHPLVFGVAEDNEVFGGMDLAFVDPNGPWIELVQPTTEGPGMEFMRQKGKGALVELDFSVNDFQKNIEIMKGKGIELIGMDGKPLKDGGLLQEWVLNEKGERVLADELLSYLPFDVARGTSIELFWEYPNGAVILRDEMVKGKELTPKSAPRLDHVVVLAADLEETTKVYTDILELKRHPMGAGVSRKWMGMGGEQHAWIQGNNNNFWIEIVAPAGDAKGALETLGEGAMVELDVEVGDIEAFYDDMLAKGILMTAGDATPLPAGAKAVTDDASGDRYAYFPLDKSEGMRIMVFERGPANSSIYAKRDESWRQ